MLNATYIRFRSMSCSLSSSPHASLPLFLPLTHASTLPLSLTPLHNPSLRSPPLRHRRHHSLSDLLSSLPRLPQPQPQPPPQVLDLDPLPRLKHTSQSHSSKRRQTPNAFSRSAAPPPSPLTPTLTTSPFPSPSPSSPPPTTFLLSLPRIEAQLSPSLPLDFCSGDKVRLPNDSA